jgi:hypothetical protein
VFATECSIQFAAQMHMLHLHGRPLKKVDAPRLSSPLAASHFIDPEFFRRDYIYFIVNDPIEKHTQNKNRHQLPLPPLQ